jgi:hypothetical protein
VCRITDYSESLDLKTRNHILSSAIQYHTYSLYSWMDLINRKTLNQTMRAISPHKEIEAYYFVKRTKEGKPTSCTTLTLKELELFKVTLPEYVPKWNKVVKEKIKSTFDEYVNVIPHVEKPVEFFLQGVDDSSYTALFKEVDEALKVLEDFKVNLITSEQLKVFNFYFSN